MPDSNRSRRTVGTLLLTAGLVILLGVAGYFGWAQLQAARLRAQLSQTDDRPLVLATPGPTEAFSQRPAGAATGAAAATAVATAVAPPVATAQPAVVAVSTSAAEPDVASATPDEAASPTSRPTVEALSQTATPVWSAPLPAAAPVRLVIPDLKIDTAVAPMGWQVIQTTDGPRSDWVVPKGEAGYHIDSAMLGQQGNLVISGHNNIYGMVFRPISYAWDNDQRVKVDDFTDRSEILNGRQVQLFDGAGNVYPYVITEFYRLKDTGVSLQQRIANARFMGPTSDTRLTLITCWPPTGNTYRLIVIAVPVQ